MTPTMFDYASQLATIVPSGLEGRVARVAGTSLAVAGFPAPLGAMAEIGRGHGEALRAEVVGFRDDLTLLNPLEKTAGIRPGDRVRLGRSAAGVGVGPGLLGRVIDAFGQPIDGKGTPRSHTRVRLTEKAPSAIDRPRIDAPLATGVRAIDGLLTCGRGQRLGIFAGSGVGKSVLLGMMARDTAADINVIALVGERGREVNEFIERDLGPDGLARSVVVVATSDAPALARVRAAETATAIAGHFRSQGKDVLLLVDSITRFALAQREIGLAAGEVATARGYPPSVFARLPEIVERAGRTTSGSITGFYSVLVEADDPQEPIADCLRGLLDGHIWLSRSLAERGHYPAIDVLASLSRLMPSVTSADQQAAATAVRRLLAAWADHEDLISIGAYREGSDPTVDAAIAARAEIDAFLRQRVEDSSSIDEARAQLLRIASAWA